MISVPYTLREFGELGVGEKHCILPNNVLTLAQDLSTESNSDEDTQEFKQTNIHNSESSKEFRKMGDR